MLVILGSLVTRKSGTEINTYIHTVHAKQMGSLTGASLPDLQAEFKKIKIAAHANVFLMQSSGYFCRGFKDLFLLWKSP